MARTAKGWTFVLVVGLLVAAGCARSPEAKKARHLERGDGYFSRQQYREAVIEFRNVLQLEGTNAHATRQLGLAHYQLGELGHALRYLLKSQELEPDNSGVRLKLATINPMRPTTANQLGACERDCTKSARTGSERNKNVP